MMYYVKTDNTAYSVYRRSLGKPTLVMHYSTMTAADACCAILNAMVGQELYDGVKS